MQLHPEQKLHVTLNRGSHDTETMVPRNILRLDCRFVDQK